MIEKLKPEDIISYKALIDECFGMSADIEQYKKYSENEAYAIFVYKVGNEIVGSVTQYGRFFIFSWIILISEK